ncbi:hypothetical protein [Silanimonas sp.]|jgi:hypothetical protein|uniref:hypothetical protein n=1 Tax=Silanimonas sp. TaxID=1929290 RepID=UPI0022BF0FE6|nr:hypothetical protein [Silanimonas sp.]MCZ8113517.1 hypothetical protein [Silanimonas sp.]
MAQDRQFSWRRSVAWAVSLALHLGLLVAMTLPNETLVPEAIVDVAPVPAWVPVDLLEPPAEHSVAARADRPRSAAAPADASPTVVAPRGAPPLAAREPSIEPADAATSETTAAAPAAAPVARTIPYLDDDARALLPMENLYSATPPPREGDYYTPGNGTEDDVFYRPRALDPNPSRFAYAWQPRGNLIDDWLGQLVEKASGKVSIPLNAKFSLVCGTVAGIAGGCVIVRNGGTGVIVQRPPPAPWDRSNRVQCRELRQAMEDAEEAVQVAYFLDRLSALCSPGSETGNDEARREAGLPVERSAPEQAPSLDQRAL